MSALPIGRNMNVFLRVAALVLFILAALLLGFSVDEHRDLIAALVPAGLACWVGASLVP